MRCDLRAVPTRVLLPLALATLTACSLDFQAERMFPERVGLGVARLSVRNAAAVLSLVTRDETCGFASSAVLENPVAEGELGADGSLTWTVEQCAIELPEPVEVSTDCHGVRTEARGRVTVMATRTVRGLLTGNPKNPIIPSDPDAVEVWINVVPEEFVVRTSASSSALTWRSGALTFRAQPHLALSASRGVCAVPTSDLTIAELRYSGGQVFVDGDGRRFNAEIPASELFAQVGKWGGRENWLEGTITVWDREVSVPSQEGSGLDPEYDTARFAASWACNADLTDPPEYRCPSLLPRVVQGAAQLTVSNFGNFADFVDRDTTCGFSSPGVLAAAELTGEVGKRGGSVTYRISTPCAFHFVEKTETSRNCHGIATYMQGKAVVTGTKLVRGIRTGSAETPIIPTSRDPAEVHITLSFEDFAVTDSVGEKALTIASGTLSGTLFTRTAIDRSTGACSLKTPVATFEDIAYENATLRVFSDGSTFRLRVSDSDLSAQNGSKDRTNYLAGTMVAEGETFSIPTQGGAPVLNPSYEPAWFDASYTCDPNLKIAPDEAACSFHEPLAQGIARLVVQTAGRAAGLVNENDQCGFEKNQVKLSPVEVVGDPGTQGHMAWQVSGCRVGRTQVEPYATDCLGAKTWLGGFASVTAKRTVRGRINCEVPFGICGFGQGVFSVTPLNPDAVTIELKPVDLEGFVTYTVPLGATQPRGKLTVHGGRLTGFVDPKPGERATEPGTYNVGTPVAAFRNLVLAGAVGTLESEGRTFKVQIDEVRVDAFNGSYGGKANFVKGTVKFDGATVPVDIPLDSTYDQAVFDTSYRCTTDLKAVLPSSP